MFLNIMNEYEYDEYERINEYEKKIKYMKSMHA